MKIVIIHGQNHKGSTYHIGRILAENFHNTDLLYGTVCTNESFFGFVLPVLDSPQAEKNMFSKKAVVISTAAGNGAAEAVKPIRRMLAYWGVPYVKTYGLLVQASNWSEVRDVKKDKISKDMAAESIYWRENGWLDGAKPWK